MKKSFLSLLIILFFLAFTSPLVAEQLTLRISGSSTLLPIIQRAAEVYLQKRPDLLLTVSGTGTGEGIRSLIDGNIDLASASRDLKQQEAQRAVSKGLVLYRQTIASDC
jgi:phosphate transport system substrate-binding protein